MKYEAVFGDQKRFNEQNNEMAEVMLWHDCLGPNFVSLKELSRMNLEGAIPHGSVVLAMRRIIRTPTWTVADQEAGKLPEVGCRVNFCHKLNTNWRTGEIKYIDDQVTVIKADDILRLFVYEIERVEFKPIESPEEKAARLREEWKNNVIEIHQGKRRKMSTSTFLLDDIYDALLSGELKTPESTE